MTTYTDLTTDSLRMTYTRRIVMLRHVDGSQWRLDLDPHHQTVALDLIDDEGNVSGETVALQGEHIADVFRGHPDLDEEEDGFDWDYLSDLQIAAHLIDQWCDLQP